MKHVAEWIFIVLLFFFMGGCLCLDSMQNERKHKEEMQKQQHEHELEMQKLKRRDE